MPDGWTMSDGDLIGLRGRCDWQTKTITIRTDLHPVDRRAVVEHEIVHAERGPVPRIVAAREEDAVRAETARRLILLDDLEQTVQECRTLREAAWRLEVPIRVLRARLEHLHPSERAWLRDRIAQRVEGA